jgi:acyl dehydratase
MTTEDIIGEIRAQHQARYGTPAVEHIEAGRVRDYLLALDEPLPDLAPGAIVPPLFLLTLGRTRRPQPTRGSAVNGGDRFEFRAPARIGDTIRTARELVAVDTKPGKNGLTFVSRIRATYTNQCGHVVAVAERRVLQWGL